MEVLQIFDSWDQEMDSWFMNHQEPLIPTLSVKNWAPKTKKRATDGKWTSSKAPNEVPPLAVRENPQLG